MGDAEFGCGSIGIRMRTQQVWRPGIAIKILPDVFAYDRERVARFTREAQTLASLNHPNIAQVYRVLIPAPDSAGRIATGRATAGRILRPFE